jgi:hypothetical protein
VAISVSLVDPASCQRVLQVLQYRQAVQAIIQGDSSTATPLLLQLLQEPLLQPPSPDTSTAAARTTAAKPAAPIRKQQQQPAQQQAVQSELLQGLRPKVLLSLAPLLGQTQAALQIWAEVLAYEPLNPKVWEEISIVLAGLGHLPLAVHAAERACGLKPSDVTMQERLVLILAALEVGFDVVYLQLLCSRGGSGGAARRNLQHKGAEVSCLTSTTVCVSQWQQQLVQQLKPQSHSCLCSPEILCNGLLVPCLWPLLSSACRTGWVLLLCWLGWHTLKGITPGEWAHPEASESIRHALMP